MRTTKILTILVLALVLMAIMPVEILADGQEVLGSPSVAIAPGSGIAVAGTGLSPQPGTINVNVPPAATVEQVLIYWYGRGSGDGVTGDDTIIVDGNPVTGTLIGESLGLPFPPSQAYRADVTSLGLVSAGLNSLTVSGLSFTFNNDGAGVIVIFDDGSGISEIQIRDGHDFAAANQGFTDPLDRMVPQTFTFPVADVNRTATLDLFIADGEASRPDAVEILVGAVSTMYENVAVGSDGDEWDTLSFSLDIPAGETMVTVEVISFDDGGDVKPDSIAWIAAALTVLPPEQVLSCRVTGGGVDSFGQWNGRLAKGMYVEENGVNRYTFGGQAGAPTASQPQPYGEWTHHQQRGPAGRFVFHAGTASAPEGTEIDFVQCSDPGWCVQARPAPAKQIDFEGIGTFKNIRKPPLALSNVVAGKTFHWFEVHIEDLGEPGKGSKQEPPSQICPPEGSAGELADCSCPDFYRITIYEGFDPQTEPVNITDVIYEVFGYVIGGNLQIHPSIE